MTAFDHVMTLVSFVFSFCHRASADLCDCADPGGIACALQFRPCRLDAGCAGGDHRLVARDVGFSRAEKLGCRDHPVHAVRRHLCLRLYRPGLPGVFLQQGMFDLNEISSCLRAGNISPPISSALSSLSPTLSITARSIMSRSNTPRLRRWRRTYGHAVGVCGSQPHRAEYLRCLHAGAGSDLFPCRSGATAMKYDYDLFVIGGGWAVSAPRAWRRRRRPCRPGRGIAQRAAPASPAAAFLAKLLVYASQFAENIRGTPPVLVGISGDCRFDSRG